MVQFVDIRALSIKAHKQLIIEQAQNRECIQIILEAWL